MGKTPEPLVALFLLFSLGLESVKGPRNDPVPSAQLPPHPRLGLSISSPPSSQKEPVFTCVSLIRLKGRGRFSRLVLPLDPVCTPPPHRGGPRECWKMRAGVWFLLRKSYVRGRKAVSSNWLCPFCFSR